MITFLTLVVALLSTIAVGGDEDSQAEQPRPGNFPSDILASLIQKWLHQLPFVGVLDANGPPNPQEAILVLFSVCEVILTCILDR